MAGNRRLGMIVLFYLGLVVSRRADWCCGWSRSISSPAWPLRPWLLNTFTLLAFGVALAWAGVIVDAWRLGYPPGLSRRHRLVLVAATVLLAALVATPLVVSARYAVQRAGRGRRAVPHG